MDQQEPHPANLNGLVFFARRSLGPFPPLSQLKSCAEYMHQHWSTKFGDFGGSYIYIFGTQCARERLKAKHRIAFMDYVETLKAQNSTIHPRVELVVSMATGFLTNIVYLCEFFEQLNVDWRFLVFDNTAETFTRIDVHGIIKHVNKQPTTLDDATLSFLATIKRANDARQSLSNNTSDLGLRGRNRNAARDRPDLNGRERQRGRARRIQVQDCPMCPRQFLTDK